MAWMTLGRAFLRAPRLLLQGDFPYTLDHMPLRVTGVSMSKRLNALQSGWDMLWKRTRLRSLPPALQIEPSNLCNLRCPLCPTGADAPSRKKGLMPLDLFLRILEETKGSLVSAVLYGWGEPFLNKELPRMISECSARGIVTATSTNGHSIQTLEAALAVVDAGLKALVIALDGSTQEVYERYRRGGNVEAVKRCAALIEEAKRVRRSPYPYTNVRAVLTRENEHDLANIRRVAVDLGVNMFSYKSVGCFTISPEYPDFETPEGELRRFARNGRHVEVRCPYAFRQPTIYWDGTVVGCEFDYEPNEIWGCIGEQSLPEIWNSPKAVRMREGILGGKPRCDFCKDCPYRDDGQEKTVLASEELKPSGAP